VLAEKALLGMISTLLDGAFEQALEIATNATALRARQAYNQLKYNRYSFAIA
jgi:hypothetical protein